MLLPVYKECFTRSVLVSAAGFCEQNLRRSFALVHLASLLFQQCCTAQTDQMAANPSSDPLPASQTVPDGAAEEDAGAITALCSLPACVLGRVLFSLTSRDDINALRLVSKLTRDAVDALIARLSINVPQASRDRRSFPIQLASLVRRSMGLDTLTIRDTNEYTRLAWDDVVKALQPAAQLHRLQALELLGLHVKATTSLAPVDQLRRLRLDGVARSDELDTSHMAAWQELQALTVANVPALRLPPSSASLHTLHIFNCKKPLDLTPLAHLPGLHMLWLHECQVADPACLAASSQLRQLSLHGVGFPGGSPPSLSQCQQLEDLSIRGWAYTRLPPLPKLLRTLEVRTCLRLEDITSASECRNLHKFSISACPGLTSLQPLASCPSLTSIEAGDCNSLRELVALRSLKRLNLWLCRALTSVSDIRGCDSLEHLDVSDCHALANISAVSTCTQLRFLAANNLRLLTDIGPLQACTALKSLQLRGCRGVRSVAPLLACTSLESLDLRGCASIVDQSCLSSLGRLDSLFC